MPLISYIGRRSLKARVVYGCVYLLLGVGALTMVYPLLLMLSGSLKSEADAAEIGPYPRFWIDDRVLFQKYVESKYNVSLEQAKAAWAMALTSWRRIEPPPPVPAEVLADFRDWRKTLPADTRQLGHCSGGKLLPANARRFRRRMVERYHGDLEAFCRESGQWVATWSGVFPPPDEVGRYRRPPQNRAFAAEYRAFKAGVPVEDTLVMPLQGLYVQGFLVPRYTRDVAAYNAAHGTAWRDYDGISLPARAPTNAVERADWEAFVRNDAPLGCIRLDPALAPAYRNFLATQRYASIGVYNTVHGTAFRGFDDVPFVEALDAAPDARVDWEEFLRDARHCPLEAITLYGPEQAFADFARARHGGAWPGGAPALGPVVAAVDYADCLANRRALRWEFTVRNYAHVFDYIARHGHGLVNTLIYCLLAVVTALVVNPLAAYALSRFRLPGTYKILLFCMATMAFPGEVTMIPGFILLKRFPLWPLLAGVGVMVGAFLAFERAAARVPERWRAWAALGLGVAAGAGLLPWLAPERATVSLLNTYAALILPGMANGFFIFLLKGFFDSLPRELYESAALDGAGEWTQFWMFTVRLSTPILAVIALGAFTGAYSAFMMALIVIPDPGMWTLMVWIYQLQTLAHPAVVFASLVIAALPTLLIFALCQNVIMRGIVVPTEK